VQRPAASAAPASGHLPRDLRIQRRQRRKELPTQHKIARPSVSVLAVTNRALTGFQRRRANKRGLADPNSGTVTVSNASAAA
jgi:hypothetical protein